MKILVTGGAGFIGSNFIRYIFSRYPKAEIINFDKLTYSGNLDNLKDISSRPGYKFIKGDIADRVVVGKIFEKYRPDYVINFAAETHVDKSVHGEAIEFIKTNIDGVFNLLEAVKNSKNIKKYVQVSTDEVYGDFPFKSKARFKEGFCLEPSSPYSASKASGDLLCMAYFKSFGVPVVITRCGNNFGPYQYPEKLIPFLILRMLENKKLPLYGSGQNIRDWIYVLDHCRALELCLLNGKAGEVYNVGANNEKNNLEIARLILGHFGKSDSCIEYVADRPGHDRRYAIDAAKIREELKWRPIYKFDDAFCETVEWYIKNKNWINNIKKKAVVFNPHIKN